MTTIEIIVVTIAAILILPYLCRFINRPALLYCSYLLLGTLLGNALQPDTHFMLDEVGNVGFILLLFIIGLEIDLPSFSVLRKSFLFCFIWFFVQNSLFVALSMVLGFGWFLGFIAGAGINACSLGIAYDLMQGQKGMIDEPSMKRILMTMVILETVAIFILAMSEVISNQGGIIDIIIRSSALVGFLFVMKSFSGIIHRQLSHLIENTNGWKIHQFLLIIFGITMIGDRLGLSAQKTAFFLGLFMNATTGKGIKFEDELRPIAHNILIPVFFISLGSKINLLHLFPYILPLSILITLFLFLIRYIIFRWKGGVSIPNRYFLLLCPNLTMVAVATGILIEHQVERDAVDLILAVGFLMTIVSSFFFPSKEINKEFEHTHLHFKQVVRGD